MLHGLDTEKHENSPHRNKRRQKTLSPNPEASVRNPSGGTMKIFLALFLALAAYFLFHERLHADLLATETAIVSHIENVGR